MNRWEIEQKIVIKSLKDPAFKKQFLAHPKETLRELLKNEKGLDLSFLDKLSIRVIEEKKEEWVLTLPCVAIDVMEVPEAELEKILGGTIQCGHQGSIGIGVEFTIGGAC